MKNILKKKGKLGHRIPSSNLRLNDIEYRRVREAARPADIEDDIFDINEALEARVRERTAELERVNRQLRCEIEERTQAEKLLRDSEEKFRVIAETASDAIVSINQDSEVTFANSAAERIFGYAISEMMGKDLTLLMPEYMSEVHMHDLTDIWVNENKQDIEWTGMEMSGRHKNNQAIPVEVSFGKSYENGTHSFHGIIRDISSRKKAEDAQNLYAQKLQKLNMSKDKFFSIIAHDLRSPFTGLLGLSDILANDYGKLSPDEARLFAGKINTSATKVFQLLNNLLEWSRVQLNGTELSPEEINLNELALDCRETLSDNIKAKNIEVAVNINPDINVTADHNMISSVMQNLVSNSLKFTGKDGRIELRAAEENDQVIISITDTGIGMSQKVIDRLFHMEKTISTPGTDNEPGSGLGLILCKEFIEKHNGEIWVDSQKGLGTTFHFSIPKQLVLI